MSSTPLRVYLDETSQTAEAFASVHGMSAWSVRHWARGDKMPSIPAQRAMEDASAGRITPQKWLEWSLTRARPAQQAAA